MVGLCLSRCCFPLLLSFPGPVQLAMALLVGVNAFCLMQKSVATPDTLVVSAGAGAHIKAQPSCRACCSAVLAQHAQRPSCWPGWCACDPIPPHTHNKFMNK